ncbi:hypothetical protein V1264_002235 [Littorina saxatilis]|uniref:Prokineticin domain-containing protein n=1 Tax=Littorina saxatilis TaxID=31220 RepID=A0AAN9C4M3_9CAEN
MMICYACFLLLVYCATSFGQIFPQGRINCMTNSDCSDLQHKCCSITPAFGKRQLETGTNFYPYVHYCLSYKTADNPWCDLRDQYSPLASNYKGLCPCGPGFKCAPSGDLDPGRYPRDRFGKCTPV